MRASDLVRLLQERIEMYGDAPIGISTKKEGCKRKIERLEDIWSVGCSGMGSPHFVYTIRAEKVK